jgi:CDGSH-type Zn-finger protein/truncated hemoglobin YjbI
MNDPAAESSAAPAGVAAGDGLREALDDARRVAGLASRGSSEFAAYASQRLSRSVLRPLADIGPGTDTPASAAAAAPGDVELSGELWRLALRVSRLRLEPGSPVGCQEAAAALQELALRDTGEDGADGTADRLRELTELYAGLPRDIQVAPDGPYLATNVDAVCDWLGQPMMALPQMAFCRCGASKAKPLCDGSHAEIGFDDSKSPSRVPDRRDTYVGQQVTIFDNRGICQHSGYCTDRLATVFHASSEPFVTPSGGRMDEIIHAVRDCPSGALSYAIDEHEARDQVDHGGGRPPGIEVTKDGPYRVTGGIPLHDGAAGQDVARAEGSSREHYALCRCGQSQNKPFCSGMHWRVEFRDPAPETGQEPTVFEWAGGLPALIRMTRLFYEKFVPEDPLLAPLFATMSADHPQRVAKWLGEVFCGPKRYSEEYGGYPRMLSQHRGKNLTEQQRARWVTLIMKSALEAGLPNDAEFRSTFGAYIEWGSRLAVENSQKAARPPEHMPMPHWDWHTAAGAPGSRISALAAPDPDEDVEIKLPDPGEPVSFAAHIRPLFRDRDRRSMSFAFDLWEHSQVAAHADAILGRLSGGTMPCDGAWPPERVEVFRRWVQAGAPD